MILAFLFIFFLPLAFCILVGYCIAKGHTYTQPLGDDVRLLSKQWFYNQDPKNFCIINRGANSIYFWHLEDDLQFAINKGFLKNDLYIDLTGGVKDFDFQGLSKAEFIGLRLEQIGFYKKEQWYELPRYPHPQTIRKGDILAKINSWIIDWKSVGSLKDWQIANAEKFFTEDGTGERVVKEYWEKATRIRRAKSLAFRWKSRKNAQAKIREYKNSLKK